MFLFFSEIISKIHYEAYEFQRIAASRTVMEKCTEQAEACSISVNIGNPNEEQEDNKHKYMDETTRKRVNKDVSFTLNSVI